MIKFIFHPNAFKIIAGKTYKQARKALRELGCTRSEQDQILHDAKENGIVIRDTIPQKPDTPNHF